MHSASLDHLIKIVGQRPQSSSKWTPQTASTVLCLYFPHSYVLFCVVLNGYIVSSFTMPLCWTQLCAEHCTQFLSLLIPLIGLSCLCLSTVQNLCCILLHGFQGGREGTATSDKPTLLINWPICLWTKVAWFRWSALYSLFSYIKAAVVCMNTH